MGPRNLSKSELLSIFFQPIYSVSIDSQCFSIIHLREHSSCHTHPSSSAIYLSFTDITGFSPYFCLFYLLAFLILISTSFCQVQNFLLLLVPPSHHPPIHYKYQAHRFLHVTNIDQIKYFHQRLISWIRFPSSTNLFLSQPDVYRTFKGKFIFFYCCNTEFAIKIYIDNTFGQSFPQCFMNRCIIPSQLRCFYGNQFSY